MSKITHSVQFTNAWKCVFPFCFKIKSRRCKQQHVIIVINTGISAVQPSRSVICRNSALVVHRTTIWFCHLQKLSSCGPPYNHLVLSSAETQLLWSSSALIYTWFGPQKSQRILEQFHLGLMKFYKIWRTLSRVYSGYNCSWRTLSRVYSGYNCSCISNKACVTPLPETFYFNDILQNLNRDC